MVSHLYKRHSVSMLVDSALDASEYVPGLLGRGLCEQGSVSSGWVCAACETHFSQNTQTPGSKQWMKQERREPRTVVSTDLAHLSLGSLCCFCCSFNIISLLL
ncbi:unnamed protein product [Polarella glacialis]|uniref:Uncharacterized protein n=1 Tax=Polarella glacialis TaxID=89957 RepID=A0A813HLQ4_POLGL|nr:unnamed protein product [Polarella glacialis]